ncbi:MAG: porin family protein [Ginsengibacter sp.]
MFKKSLLAACLLFSMQAFSQKYYKANHSPEKFFRIGAKAGVNINKISGESYKEGFYYNYLLGGFMQFNFSRTLGFQPEINFVQSSSEFSNSASNVYDDLFKSGDQRKVKLDYVKIPLLLNVNVGQSNRVKLQLGPQFGSLLNQHVDNLDTDRNIFKKSDFSAVGGLWIQLPLVNLGGRYEIGLNNINDIDNSEKWRNQAFTIFVGITL